MCFWLQFTVREWKQYQMPPLRYTVSYLFFTQQRMQNAAEVKRDLLWERLKVPYDKYADNTGEIAIPRVEEFIVEVLGEEDKGDRDYVMKNLFRLDVDGSGTASYTEMANFLFKRHCGEMSLQKVHRKGEMSHGAERKMTLPEFNALVNRAYRFLEVELDAPTAHQIFTEIDVDEDKLITYVEYFKFIEKYVCRPANYKVPKSEERPKVDGHDQQGTERFSKLRRYIWDNLRKLYEAYVHGRCLAASDAEFRALVVAIVGNISEEEITFICLGLLKHHFRNIEFQPFAIYFIYLVAELGLQRFAKNNPPESKRTLTRDEFVRVLSNSFSFLRLDLFRKSILWKIFDKIDTDHDGLISYQQYLLWVKNFLCVVRYFGDEYYVEEDDELLDPSDPFEKNPEVNPSKAVNNQFNFSDLTFAKKVRARMYELLVTYDADHDEEFSKAEIEKAMTELLKSSPEDLHYLTANVFRYDKDNNNIITFDEMTNFCVEQHFGEMAIQRLHRKKFYSKGAERIMNQEEFGSTLNHALDYIGMQAPPDLIALLFREIDLDGDGWITYVVYFLFLRYYFGSLSVAREEQIKDEKVAKKKLTEDEEFLASLKDLSPWDRFVRILVDQLRKIVLMIRLHLLHVFSFPILLYLFSSSSFSFFFSLVYIC